METIEEAAEKHKEEFSFLTKSTANQKRLSFIAGANWQKEHDKHKFEAYETMIWMRYTEEEVKILLLAYNLNCIRKSDNLTTSIRFEQNKKK